MQRLTKELQERNREKFGKEFGVYFYTHVSLPNFETIPKEEQQTKKQMFQGYVDFQDTLTTQTVQATLERVKEIVEERRHYLTEGRKHTPLQLGGKSYGDHFVSGKIEGYDEIIKKLDILSK